MADLQALADAIIGGDQSTAVNVTKEAIEEGMGPDEVLNNGLVAGMAVVGRKFKNNEVYIPEVLIAARAMKGAMELLEPELVKSGVEPKGTVVIGTVQGDLHDIGKNLVAMMLKGAGFNVVDLGVDCSPDKYVQAAKESGAEIVAMSALLTTTMPAMEKGVKAMKDAGLDCKVMIGGAPVTQGFADKIGADGYSEDAASAVDLAEELIA
ncbi:corrinoid protein [Sedimentisphaera salicampi]|uniref:Methionine synthase n=1 Tax=Sedimentisphaera salicampi TaxID=1941349 RepID=A0A1W6LNL9_9BACT|nr:corrinoid protein [Sedimentisphaera salicampi]ARN57341.1 Methionine synthase [Sedimentisphaera salicampi]OXU14654.1 Methionine synthase [Sedimentisphaera salicampi]